MKTIWTRVLAGTFLSLTALMAQRAETVVFRAAMSPANEVPAINIEASGTATIVARFVRDAAGNVVSGTADFNITYSFPGPITFTGLHIHRNPAGVNGGVVIDTGLNGANTLVDEVGRGTISRPAQIRANNGVALSALTDMLQNPNQFYVNLHSTVNPGGVIRGQLYIPDQMTLMTLLSPANEVPVIPNDATGLGTIIAMRTFDEFGRVNTGAVIFESDYDFKKEVTLSGWHIHNALAGLNGGVVIDTVTSGVVTAATGRGTMVKLIEIDLNRPVALDALNRLFEDPQDFYVNMHTTEFPSGLIRGQLARPETKVYSAHMLPSNENPPIEIDAEGVGQIVVHQIRGRDGRIAAGRVEFDINFRFPGPVTFTGLHIHDQVVGLNGPVTINTGLTATPFELGFGNITRQVYVTTGQALTSLNSLDVTPENHYVNLHSTVSPGGVVRAQLSSPRQ